MYGGLHGRLRCFPLFLGKVYAPRADRPGSGTLAAKFAPVGRATSLLASACEPRILVLQGWAAREGRTGHMGGPREGLRHFPQVGTTQRSGFFAAGG